jgi:DNA polymerase I
MNIRGVMARKGDTPEYVGRMQQELFDILAKARSLDELRMIEACGKRGSRKVHA